MFGHKLNVSDPTFDLAQATTDMEASLNTEFRKYCRQTNKKDAEASDNDPEFEQLKMASEHGFTVKKGDKLPNDWNNCMTRDKTLRDAYRSLAAGDGKSKKDKQQEFKQEPCLPAQIDSQSYHLFQKDAPPCFHRLTKPPNPQIFKMLKSQAAK